jgi:hypothetical protein
MNNQTTKFNPGQSGNPAGRPKGAKDKLQQELKEMIRAALDESGGVAYLTEQAKLNPVAFLSLLAKILPKDLNLQADTSINIILHKNFD